MRPASFIGECVAGHGRITETVNALDDDRFGRPSLLPGWSRGQVVAWLALKSRSHTHLLDGAIVGEVRSQFPDRYDQAAAVSREASRGASHLRAALASALAELEAAWERLPDDLWASVGTTTAGPRTMAEIVTRHLRDLEVHHVDLDAGYTPSDWPRDFVEFELAKRIRDLESRAGSAALLAWLLGRRPAPELGPW